MLVECWSVILIVLVICVVYLKSHKNQYAFTVLPLCILPLGHILGTPLARWLYPLCSLSFSQITVAVDVVSVVLSALLLGLFSKNIQNKKARTGFLILCGLFNVILAAVLIESNL